MVNRDELTSEGTVVNGVHLSNDERQPCEVWTRVMGYHRPVSSFNIGKKGEYHERQMFSESAADVHGELVSAFPPAGGR